MTAVDPGLNSNIQSVPQVPRPEYISVPAVQAIKYAGFWVRVAAWFVDAVLVGLPLSFMSMSGVFGNTIYASIFPIIAVWGYILFMVAKYQATLGKMVVGLLIQGTNGEKIGFGRVFMREIIGKIISSLVLCVGYLMVAWTGKKQGLHDKIADTIVIEKDPNKSKKGWVVFAVLAMISSVLISFGILVATSLSIYNSGLSNESDASVEAKLSGEALEAKKYFDTNGTYAGFCVSLEARVSDRTKSFFDCNDAHDTWATSLHLLADGDYKGKYNCIDSTGRDVITPKPLAENETSCDTDATPVQ